MTDGLLQRMSGVLQRYGVDPKDLSQEQLYKLALILQLLQAQDKSGTLPKYCIKTPQKQVLKRVCVSLLKSFSVLTAEPLEKDLIALKEVHS